MNRIYLDNNATTGMDPRVVKAMVDDLSSIPANPSSIHSFGREAKQRLHQARSTIADSLNIKPNEIIFTSGGTESLNMLLYGLALKRGDHLITTDVEHSAIFNSIKRIETQGVSVSYLPVGPWGAATPHSVEAAITPNTRLIVLTAANNETGVKTEIAQIALLAKRYAIPFIVDGVALLGKEPLELVEGISGMGFSGHKIHGPKGVGFAFVRSTLKLHPLLVGGEQEYGRRPGSENLTGILGLATAVALLDEELKEGVGRMRRLRDYLEKGLKERVPALRINGQGPRISNTSNLTFPGIDGESLLIALDLAGVAASHGSACTSGALEPSRVLLNMGLSPTEARSSLRFSLSRWTTQEEIDKAIQITSSIVAKLSPLSQSENREGRHASELIRQLHRSLL
jgi:cysteine desulfurase